MILNTEKLPIASDPMTVITSVLSLLNVIDPTMEDMTENSLVIHMSFPLLFKSIMIGRIVPEPLDVKSSEED